MNKLFAALMLIGLSIPVLAHAQTAPPEHVIARYPAQWVAQPAKREDNLTVVRLLPPGQTEEDYNEAILIERHEQDHKAPRDFVLSRVEASRRSCEEELASKVDESPINGYNAATIQFTCTKSHRNGKSGVMMIRAMAGRDALHVVTRLWIGPPVTANQLVPIPNQTIQEWIAFAQTIMLCDTRDPQHPCPVKAISPTTEK